jgi:ribosomal protein S12 methylthiotransferase accessory factor YcaO
MPLRPPITTSGSNDLGDPDLPNVISQWIEVERLGEGDCALYLAHARLIVSITAFDGASHSIELDSAGVDVEPSGARTKCCYELIEKLVGSAPATVSACVRAGADRGPRTVSWQSLAPYPNAELRRLSLQAAGLPRHWCRAHGMRTGSAYDVPASKVLPAWSVYAEPGSDDGECDASGLAAGPPGDIDRCWAHGLCEVLERDALMLAWRLPGWPIAELGDAARMLPVLADFLAAHGLSARLFEVGDPALIPVVLCVLSESDGSVTCGSACSFELARSAFKSVLEAVMLWNAMHRERSDGIANDVIRSSRDHVLYGWRNGRSVVQWFENLPRRGGAETPGGLPTLIERCAERFFGAEPLVVELADGGDPGAGVYVCRAVQPHACRKEWNGKRPFVGGRRLSSLRAAGDRLNPLPHPYG